MSAIIAKKVLSHLIDHTPFILEQKKGGVRVKTVAYSSKEEKKFAAKKLISLARCKIRSNNFDSVSYEKFEKIRDIVDAAYDFVRAHKLKELECDVLALKLGGKISSSTLSDGKYRELIHLIKANALHHQFQAARVQLKCRGKKPTIPVHVHGLKINIPWAAITKKEKGDIVSYSNQGRILFETDKKGVLTQKYSIGKNGIQKYAPRDPKGKIIPYEWRDPASWGKEYVLEIVTVTVDKKGEKPALLLGTTRLSTFFIKRGRCIHLASLLQKATSAILIMPLHLDQRLGVLRLLILTFEEQKAVMILSAFLSRYLKSSFMDLKEI